MTDRVSKHVIITAEADRALVPLCGISLLERLLRILQRLGVSRVTIVSPTADAIRSHIEPPSWARADVAVEVLQTNGAVATAEEIRKHAPSDAHIVLIDGGSYFDSRLLAPLLRHEGAALLIDSTPPPVLRPLTANASQTSRGAVCGAATTTPSLLQRLDDRRAVFQQLAETREIEVIDVHEQPTYVTDMRRHVRPLWFPAPLSPEATKAAEDLLLDAAQNGTLDLPAIAHAPIETGIIRRLCRTRITPMHITLFTAAVSAIVAALFASGQLLAGTWLALIVGVLDGLDGKQARVKVETTELGKREHVLDYVLELSWWLALAYHFATSDTLSSSYALALLLIGSDLLDRYAKRIAKQHTGRNLDDAAPIDRFVRLIGGRRNIYIWIFAIGLALDSADKAFAFFCCWGTGTAAIHMWRAFSIARQARSV